MSARFEHWPSPLQQASEKLAVAVDLRTASMVVNEVSRLRSKHGHRRAESNPESRDEGSLRITGIDSSFITTLQERGDGKLHRSGLTNPPGRCIIGSDLCIAQ